MSAFERLNYNFDSNNFGEAQYLPRETINLLKITADNDLFTWQKERLQQNNKISILEYRKNPFEDICGAILNRANDIVANTGVDYTGWVAGDTMPGFLYTAANDLTIELYKFKEHTGNLAGVTTYEFPDPNVPRYETATIFGRQSLNILYQTEQVSNAIPILGSFTSLYIDKELQSSNSIFYSDTVTGYLNNPAGTTVNVITDLTSNINSLKTLIETRRIHDCNFFANTKGLVEDYVTLKSLEISAKSNSEFEINQIIGTENFKVKMLEQKTEAAEKEYNREYVNRSHYGEGSGPPPEGIPGEETGSCTVPSSSPQYIFNFTSPTGSVAPGSPVVCSAEPPGTQNYVLSLTSNRIAMTGLSNAGIAAIRFPSGSFGRGGVLSITSPVPSFPAGYQFEAIISDCPGSFSIANGNTTGCGGFYVLGSGSVVFNTTNSIVPDSCRLSPNRDYYLNLRWRASNGQGTCREPTGCSAYIDFLYR